jgi:hypothetical protein
VPGVSAEVLGVKVVAEEKASKRGQKRRVGDVEVEQLGLDL